MSGTKWTQNAFPLHYSPSLSRHLFSLSMSSRILNSKNSWECNHAVVTFFTVSSSWNFWPERRFFKCNNKWKLLGRRSGLYTWWSKTSQLKRNNCCVALTVCALAFLCSKQGACQQPSPSVLNWMSKPFQCFTICCNVYGGSWGVKSPRRTPFQSQ